MAKKIVRKSSKENPKKNTVEQNWIELFPFGISLAYGSRPVMIFKDEEEELTLPVWLNEMDAGLALAEADPNNTVDSPHFVTKKIMEEVGAELKECYFVEIIGHHQYVNLIFGGHRKLKSMRCRADQAMSLCVTSEARFFATQDYVDSCKIMDSALQVAAEELISQPGVEESTQKYLI